MMVSSKNAEKSGTFDGLSESQKAGHWDSSPTSRRDTRSEVVMSRLKRNVWSPYFKQIPNLTPYADAVGKHWGKKTMKK